MSLTWTLITAGSTVFHPVQVPGAHFYTGDCHAAQCNGEVSLTATEASQAPTFRVILHKEANLEEEAIPVMKNPWGETEEAYISHRHRREPRRGDEGSCSKEDLFPDPNPEAGA